MSTKRVASVLKRCFLFQKSVHVMITTNNIIPVITDNLFGEPHCVSPCNCLGSSSTRFDESFVGFGSIFLYWDFEIWGWINFIP